MNFEIKKISEKELLNVVRLNNLEQKWVGKKDGSFFEKYFNSPFFLGIFIENTFGGFILVMDEKTDYDSPNFLWFKENVKEFYYIDRIVIDKKFRGQGFGKLLYEYLFSQVTKSITAEVAIIPKNSGSLIFHDKLGFKRIGKFSSGGKTCVMYKK
jgi:hypothetical protein